MIRIVCYGVGDRFHQIIDEFDFEKVKIVALMDQDIQKAEAEISSITVQDKPIAIRPSDIISLEFDYVVICSDLYCEEMEETLRGNGVQKSNICFAGSLPVYLPSRNFSVDTCANAYFSAVNRNNEILTQLLLADEAVCHVVRDIRKLGRPRRIKRFHERAKEDYVRVSTLELLADQVIKNNIEGDIAELGVFRGNFSSLLNEMFPTRNLYLFDTFEGFNEDNLRYDTENRYLSIEKTHKIIEHFKITSIEYVLSKMPYPNKCIIKKGYFPETAVDISDAKFSLVSLDVDLYTPTYEGLQFFYSRLNYGGYIMIHDYGDCSTFLGVRDAVERFCAEKSIPLIPVSDLSGSVIIPKY